MPWRGPEYPGEFPTLGFEVAELIEAKCAIPDGEHVGEPFLLTDEQLRFLLWHYRIRPDAIRSDKPSSAFAYRRSQLVRPQKWGKGPLSAAIACAEGDHEGPVLFDGWDARGEPVGRPWATPWIQVTAVSEGQTDNVWRALLPMIELGSIRADMPDTGQTRINLPSGGRIEPVTASARSRLGQRITFAVQDQTESWFKTNGGWQLADNQRRNLAGMGGRSIETPNAWDPAEQSVAQLTFEAKVLDIFRDYPPPPPGSIRNKRERRRVLRAVYGDSRWVDLDRIEAEIEELISRDSGQAERFFLNRVVPGAGQAIDPGRWAELATPGVVPLRSLVVVGVDGARFEDALAIVGTDVETARQFVIGIWERPEDAPDDYEHPADEIDGAMIETFQRFDVWRAYIDPQWIEHLVDKWQGRWGIDRVHKWYTNRPRQIAWAVRNYVEAIGAGDLSHDGHAVMAQHIANARRRKLSVFDDEHRQMYTLGKDRPDSPNKMDGAMAGTLSWEARGDAIAAGAKKRPPPQIPGRIR